MNKTNLALLDKAQEIINISLGKIRTELINTILSLSEDYDGERAELLIGCLKNNGYSLSENLSDWDNEIDEFESKFFALQDALVKTFLYNLY